MSLAPDGPPVVTAATRERVQIASSNLGSAVVLVTVGGDLDAANALSLSRFVEPLLETTGRLIIDLRSLEFFGTQGFSILHRINVMCSRFNVNWVVLPGVEVDRLLRICDPDACLPVAATLEDAIATAGQPPRCHLRLVSGS